MSIRQTDVPVRNLNAQRGIFVAELLIVLAIVAIIALMAAIGTPGIFQARRATLGAPAGHSIRKSNSSSGRYRFAYGDEGLRVSPGTLSGAEVDTGARDQTCKSSRRPTPCEVRKITKRMWVGRVASRGPWHSGSAWFAVACFLNTEFTESAEKIAAYRG